MNFRKLATAAMASTLLLVGGAAAGASLTYQNVTFESLAIDQDTMAFSIVNATNATGNWSTINYLKGFEIKDIGGVTGVLSITPSNVTPLDLNMNANGCPGPAGNAGMCFLASTPITLTDSMSWEITFTGTNLDFGSPHIKVNFYETLTQAKATGDLLSLNLAAPVPEPETYAMLIAGLAVMGFVARRRSASFRPTASSQPQAA